MCKHV
jgi:hypothetical protein